MGLSPGLWNENAANHHSYHRPQVRQTSSADLQTPRSSSQNQKVSVPFVSNGVWYHFWATENFVNSSSQSARSLSRRNVYFFPPRRPPTRGMFLTPPPPLLPFFFLSPPRRPPRPRPLRSLLIPRPPRRPLTRPPRPRPFSSWPTRLRTPVSNRPTAAMIWNSG